DIMSFYRSFFFSSRGRHTRFSRDWSSDVCSSDLGKIVAADNTGCSQHMRMGKRALDIIFGQFIIESDRSGISFHQFRNRLIESRSEERRVGKSCELRRARNTQKKTNEHGKVQIYG